MKKHNPGNVFSGIVQYGPYDKNAFMSDPLFIFADGSFNPDTQSGGWAFVVYENGRQIHADSGAAAGPANNGFEVLAVLKALIWLATEAPDRKAVLQTDSRHVVEGCHRWRTIWRGNGWKRVNPNPRARRRQIPDADLWQGVDRLLLGNPGVVIEWCKGHSGVAGNDVADCLARNRMHAT